MEQLEEINLKENLEEALFRRWKATTPGPDGIAERETIHVQVANLDNKLLNFYVA